MKDQVGFLVHPSEDPDLDAEYGDLTGEPVRRLLVAEELRRPSGTVYLVTDAPSPRRQWREDEFVPRRDNFWKI